MKRNFNFLKNKKFDVLVIGGGINGAAIANIAAAHGQSVCLVEKRDFASGTSSKSSKLIHGGIRYLENFEFKLVHEALVERAIHLTEVPYLVKPISFLIPVYKGDRRPLWMMRLGVFLYDILAGRHNIARHQAFSAKQLLKLEPALKPDGLTGGVMYFDAQMDDARLCLENVLAAKSRGAETLNYVETVSFLKENGRVVGVTARDVLNPDQKIFEVRARKTIVAVGPWTNILLKMDNPEAPELVRTTKGIHIVYPKRISSHALLIPSARDNRIFFVIPWEHDNTLIGTTDTDFRGNPDDVEANAEDIQYLIEETKRVFPSVSIDQNEIVTFAGLRPLVQSPAGSPSKISREHSIFATASGIIFVTGGKYTTYRIIAREALSRFIPLKKDERYPLYGSGEIHETVEQVAREFGVERVVTQLLMEKYGARYRDILKLTIENPELKERICPHMPVIKAQIAYAIQTEMAQCAEDIIMRRLSLGYNACVMKECQKAIQQAVSQFL